jgi:pyridoxal phosphate phosphatase PHOSPHO2
MYIYFIFFKKQQLNNFSTKMRKNLALFDFDHTVLDNNSDIVIRDLLDKSLIPLKVKQLFTTTGWVEYMQEIFKLVHQNGYSPDFIKQRIIEIPEVPGIVNCIKTLHASNFDVVIISDSNSEFIKAWTDEQNITPLIHSVFTNPAAFNENGLLEIKPYHYQTECTLSSQNLCKGQIMEDFIQNCGEKPEPVHFASTYYMGDGRNDICPMLRLPNGGFACPRIGYHCSKELENVIASKNHDMKAKIQRWTNGNDLLDFILSTCEKCK